MSGSLLLGSLQAYIQPAAFDGLYLGFALCDRKLPESADLDLLVCIHSSLIVYRANREDFKIKTDIL